MEFLLVLVVFVPLIAYVAWTWYLDRKYPFTFNCDYCRPSGTIVHIKSNDFGVVRQFQLDHLDDFHSDE